MKIESSTIAMGSTRTYSSSATFARTTQLKNLETGEVNEQSSKATFSYSTEENNLFLNLYQKKIADFEQANEVSSNQNTSNNVSNGLSSLTSLADYATSDTPRDQFIKSLIDFMEKVKENLLSTLSNSSIKDQSKKGSNIDFSIGDSYTNLNLSSGVETSVWHRSVSTSITYEETESTLFSSTGTVNTADGKSINFNVNLTMSREFLQESTSLTEDVVTMLTDPLVINLNNAPTNLSDSTWNFDIDSDGVMDNLSMLSSGSGFLALDHNGNGSIDNGSELFGTRSGNGFKDLAQYDEDKNGWIDENDSVFTKLKIWVKNDAGEDKLLDLKQGDIGAIYLGSSTTNFSINNQTSNQTKGQIRQSGIYLKESGSVHTLQQIDLAKHNAS